jgi:phosphohistidine phosphatase
MELYLFRHGIAEDGKPGSSDANRELTNEGRKKVAEVLKAARKSGVEPSLIISSPYKRAAQTAALAATGLDYTGGVLHTDTLVPHGSPEKVWSELREHKDETAILLAGHEPLMSRLVAFLLTSPALRIEMKKAAMVRIDVAAFGAVPHGTLRWMIYPKLI